MVLDSNLGECNCTVSEPEYAWVWLTKFCNPRSNGD